MTFIKNIFFFLFLLFCITIVLLFIFLDKYKIEKIIDDRLNQLTPKMVKDIIQDMIKKHLGWLVVWGGFFGGLIGLIFSIILWKNSYFLSILSISPNLYATTFQINGSDQTISTYNGLTHDNIEFATDNTLTIDASNSQTLNAISSTADNQGIINFNTDSTNLEIQNDVGSSSLRNLWFSYLILSIFSFFRKNRQN